MRLALLLASLLACAHSPPPPSGPRPLSGLSTMVHGDANLEIRLFYRVGSDRSVELICDLRGTGTGSIGQVKVDVAVSGFVIDGSPGWGGEIAAGGAAHPTVNLRPLGDKTGWAKFTVTHVADGNDITVFVPFLITPDEIRPCQPADEACKHILDPTATGPG